MKKFLSIALLSGGLLLSGCGSSENFVFTNNNNPVVSAPVCADDAYTTNQNQALTVNAANGVLANDQPNGGTVTFAATSAQGGTIVGSGDGSFTYTPFQSFNGVDSFTYNVSNEAGQTTCTVTITVISTNGFFVDATNGNDATGSFVDGNPFATIQAAVTAAGTNQDIVVRPGTYSGNVTLLNGQRLLGSGSTLINAQGETRPIINGAGIILADNNTVDFIRIQNTPGDAIFGNGSSGITISDCEIEDTATGGEGVVDDRATGDWTITDNTLTNVGSIGISLSGETGDNLTALVQANVITGSMFGAMTFSYGGSGTVRAQVLDNQMTDTINTGATMELICRGADTDMCFEIRGNINDDVYSMGRLITTSTLEVVQLSQLTSINSGGATLENGGGGVFPATETAACTTP